MTVGATVICRDQWTDMYKKVDSYALDVDAGVSLGDLLALSTRLPISHYGPSLYGAFAREASQDQVFQKKISRSVLSF